MASGFWDCPVGGGLPIKAKNIFIVEDHPGMRQALQRLLEPVEAYRVIGEAESAEAALEQLSTLQVDLCLVDLSLPGMSGIQLIERLKDQEPRLRCLVVTSHTDSMYEAAALSAGAAGYVTKGDPEAVLNAVCKVLGNGGEEGGISL